jgi:hypothetical protein
MEIAASNQNSKERPESSEHGQTNDCEEEKNLNPKMEENKKEIVAEEPSKLSFETCELIL